MCIPRVKLLYEGKGNTHTHTYTHTYTQRCMRIHTHTHTYTQSNQRMQTSSHLLVLTLTKKKQTKPNRYISNSKHDHNCHTRLVYDKGQRTKATKKRVRRRKPQGVKRLRMPVQRTNPARGSEAREYESAMHKAGWSKEIENECKAQSQGSKAT